MKRIVLAVFALAIVASIGVWVSRRQTDMRPGDGVGNPARTSRIKARASAPASAPSFEAAGNLAPNPTAHVAMPPAPMHVFADDGSVEPEFIARYGVKAADLARLSQARDAAMARIVALDRSHADLDPGNDGAIFKGSVKPYPEEGAAIHDHFYGLLHEILGEEAYRDYLANENVNPNQLIGYEIRFAGLIQKAFELDRTPDAEGRSQIKLSIGRVLHLPGGTGEFSPHPSEVKSSISAIVRTRSELRALDPFLVDVAPSWVP